MEKEIIQCEEKFLQALRTSNIEEILELLHNDLIYNNAFGSVISKEEDLEDFRSANPMINTLECVERKVQVFGDTAIVSTVIHLKGIFGGNLVEGNSRFLRTWKKFGNDWKIIAAASINLA